VSYLVFCTFDLKNASAKDYENAYSDLKSLGLSKVQKTGNGGEAVIPTTSAMGEFSGSNAATVRDDIRAKIKAEFTARRFKSEIFVIVGGDWAWGATST
jgi:hypothetical protein